jgi:Pyruvate/2-oxoacid:ferredoxin oxidoreductase delta subunit
MKVKEDRGILGERSRPRLVAVVTNDCTGCHACVDFCLVDCIDEAPQETSGAARIHIREDECIGCRLCALVCDHLALHAIRLVPVRGPADAPVAGRLASVA